MSRTLLSVSTVLALLLALTAAPPVHAQDDGWVQVTVTDAGGAPLSGVQVRWDGGTGSVPGVAWTNPDGTADVYGTGDVQVRAEAPAGGHAIQWLGGTAGRTGSTAVSLPPDGWAQPEAITLPAGGAISGTATMADGSAAPPICALVRTADGDLVTRAWADDDGRFETRSSIPPGDYVVELQHCGSDLAWGWHGGHDLHSAATVGVSAGRVTAGVDAVLDPAAMPRPVTPGRPLSDAEVEEAMEDLNGHRRQIGVPEVDIDWTMVDAQRLNGRYRIHHPAADHAEDPTSPWFTAEGHVAAATSGLGHGDIATNLGAAPFHWLGAMSPQPTWGAVAGWVADDVHPAALHTRPGIHDDPPQQAPVEWPLRWPAPDSIAAGRLHEGEFPPPAGACEDHDPSQDAGYPMIAQFDHDGPQVDLQSHAVTVDGRDVEVCAITADGYTNPMDSDPDTTIADLMAHNAVILLPRLPLPPGAEVRASLTTTTHGETSWTFRTPSDPVRLGTSLQGVPGEVLPVAQEPTARQAALALSQRRFGPAEHGPQSRIVLCREDVFPDCLALSPFLDMYGGTLLFTEGGPGGTLPPEVREEVQRLLALPDAAATVTIVGGVNAVSQAQEDELRSLAIDPQRLQGPERISTAAAIASQVWDGAPPGMVLLARHDDWADAITAGAFAANRTVPIILTPTDDLHPDTAAWLAERPAIEVVVLGGTAAISTAVEQRIRDLGHPVRRVQGPSRVETSVAIAEQLWGRTTTENLEGFAFVDTFDPDGWQPTLLLGQLASQMSLPVLVAGESIHPAVAAYLDRAVPRQAVGVVAGSSAARSAAELEVMLGG